MGPADGTLARVPQIVGLRCPHCAAALKVEVGATSAKCEYCGTTSLLRGGTIAPQAGGRGRAAGKSGCGVIAVVLGVVVVGVIAALVFLASAPSPPSAPVRVEHSPSVVAVPPVIAAPAPTPPPARELTIDTRRRPLLVDVDADGAVDVVALTEVREDARRHHAYVALSAATGALLWQIDVPDEAAGDSFAAAAHGRLLLLDDKGQLRGHDLRTGAAQWTTALGERGTRFCASATADAIDVPTADDRVLAIDVKTGRQTPVAAAPGCAAVPTDRVPVDRDPAARDDPRAPAGTVSIRCGSVTAYTSSGMTRLKDQCRARSKIDVDGLPGLVAHALWRVPAGWVVLGVRKPGTYVPTVGLVDARTRKLLWKADVPEGNPLLADEGSPTPVVLLPAHLVVGYTVKDQPQHLTAFALEDGARAWHIDVPGGERVQQAAAADGRLFLYGDGAVHILDAASGALVRSLGRARAAN